MGGGGDLQSFRFKSELLKLLQTIPPQEDPLARSRMLLLTERVLECSFDFLQEPAEYFLYLKPDSISVYSPDLQTKLQADMGQSALNLFVNQTIWPYFDSASQSGGYYFDARMMALFASPTGTEAVVKLFAYLLLTHEHACLQ